jgi:hypothetical protein
MRREGRKTNKLGNIRIANNSGAFDVVWFSTFVNSGEFRGWIFPTHIRLHKSVCYYCPILTETGGCPHILVKPSV